MRRFNSDPRLQFYKGLARSEMMVSNQMERAGRLASSARLAFASLHPDSGFKLHRIHQSLTGSAALMNPNPRSLEKTS
jgi:hypothetical protein